MKILAEFKMSSMSKIDQENLVVIELANRQLIQDLAFALIAISNKKQNFKNLDKYEEKKRILFGIFNENQATTIDNHETVRTVFTYFNNISLTND